MKQDTDDNRRSELVSQEYSGERANTQITAKLLCWIPSARILKLAILDVVQEYSCGPKVTYFFG